MQGSSCDPGGSIGWLAAGDKCLSLLHTRACMRHASVLIMGSLLVFASSLSLVAFAFFMCFVLVSFRFVVFLPGFVFLPLVGAL